MKMVSSASAVGGREDLRVDDVAARGRAGAGDDGEQARVVGRQDGELGHAPERVGLDLGGDGAAGMLRLAARSGACFSSPGRLDLQPVGRVVARRVGLELRVATSRAAPRAALLRQADPLRARRSAEWPPPSTTSVS